jgi:putative transport protein
MHWFTELLFHETKSGVAHAIAVMSLVIAIGVLLGKIKFKNVSLGSTWILFTGIVLSHFGLRINGDILNFLKEFGLILFVYAIGLQVGPGFFASIKKGGFVLNIMALSVVLLGVFVTFALHLITGIPIQNMVGIMSGAVTNTPGLGAAQSTYQAVSGIYDVGITAGYAVAYPLAVVGIIFTIIAFKYIFKIDLKTEESATVLQENERDAPRRLSLHIENPAVDGRTLAEVHELINRNFVISHVRTLDGTVFTHNAATILHVGEDILLVTSIDATAAVTAFLGRETSLEWTHLNTELVSKGIIITKPELNGKTITQTRIRSFGINVTWVHRFGVDLVPRHNLHLQIGDRLNVVGTASAVAAVEKKLGNSARYLNEPNLFPIFLGIFLGVILGSMPIIFPGVPQPIKLGLAGGPLIVSLLISRFGTRYKLVTYSSTGANFMLREVGISIFLACVGLGAGEGFVDIVMDGGYLWIGYGILITVIPLAVIGTVARYHFKLDYFTLSGLLSGAMTDPPALSYSNEVAKNDIPSIAYATVYPLTMFSRILFAQLMIVIML